MTTSFTTNVLLVEIDGICYLEVPKTIVDFFSLRIPRKFKLVVSENEELDILFLNFAALYKSNITENNKMTDHKKEQNRKEKMAIIGEMPSQVNHELRNVISVLQNELFLLQKENPRFIKENKKRFDIVNKSIVKINKVTSDNLNFLKEYDLEKRIHSINEIISETLELVYVPDHVKIRRILNTDRLYCDQNSIEIVFANLLRNAIDAIEENGTIDIRSSIEGCDVKIQFSNSGPPIPNEIVNQIFQPLFTTKSSGTGLGLAICKKIIEKNGGTISCSNEPTTFTILLPDLPLDR